VGEAGGKRLLEAVRHEFTQALDPEVPRGGVSTGLTGIQKAALKPKPRRDPLQPGSPGSTPRAAEQAIPGLPMPPSLKHALSAAPDDSSCFERARDTVLLFFAHKHVSLVLFGVAVVVSLAVVGFGVLICWTMLGLFFEIDNGWGKTRDVCLNSTGWNATEMKGTSVPMLDGEYVTTFCNLNQWWFNTCIKAFVVLFSYINFLPIPWRVSCFHHVYCSRRPNEEGVDFYGRPTDALWFNLSKATRRKISLGLNLAWMCHFAALATHIVWPEYIEGTTWPHVLYHNLPEVLSLFFQISAASAQYRAEDRLIEEEPERFPPKPLTLVLSGWRKWRSGEFEGTLMRAIAAQFPDESTGPSSLTGIVSSAGQRPSHSTNGLGRPCTAAAQARPPASLEPVREASVGDGSGSVSTLSNSRVAKPSPTFSPCSSGSSSASSIDVPASVTGVPAAEEVGRGSPQPPRETTNQLTAANRTRVGLVKAVDTWRPSVLRNQQV